MFKLVYEAMVDCDVEIRLETEVMLDCNRKIMTNKDNVYRRKTKYILTHPDMVLFINVVHCK